MGSNNVFVTNDGGSTCELSNYEGKDKVMTHGINTLAGSAVAGQNNTYIPHKGVLSPAEKSLYVSYSNGAGPVRFSIKCRE